MEKTCFKCGERMPIALFYRHPRMADGHLGKCKKCTRKDTKTRTDVLKNDPEWAAKEAERQRKKSRAANTESPEVLRARRAVRSLGRSMAMHWHHWSYQEAHKLDCIHMTPPEHRRAHRFLVYDREHLMYRRCDTMELLDTRERHEAFLSGYVATQPL